MKSRARAYFWWPLMDSNKESISKSCEQCLTSQPEPSKTQISPWPLCNQTFERIHVDFCEYSGKNFLIITDSCSKWIEAYQMSLITSTETINRLRDCFARFGLPETIVSDNGPQFTSSEFKIFARETTLKQ